LHSVKLRINRNIHAGISRYYANESNTKPQAKQFTTNIIPDPPRVATVETW
jgi:hypothetical protein